jgi:transposase
MAVIGDTSRFTHKGALITFVDVDPGFNESVTYKQKSVHTSIRGSAPLRKTLFGVMNALIKISLTDDPVYPFMNKKHSEDKDHFVYTTSRANKFLRVYYESKGVFNNPTTIGVTEHSLSFADQLPRGGPFVVSQI